MAISRDNNVTTTVQVSGASQTLSYTTAGTGRFLAVAVGIQSSQTCTGVTYNGVSMTQQDTSVGATASENVYLFTLTGPASGANDIVASFSGSATSFIAAASYNGVNQTAQPEAHNVSSTAAGTSLTTSVTTLTDNAWLVGYARAFNTQTAGSNTVFMQTAADSNMADTNAVQTPTGSYSLNTSFASGRAALFAISIAPATQTTVSLDVGVFSLTGVALLFNLITNLVLSTGTFALTGISATLTIFQKWIKQALNSSVMTNVSKASSSWNNNSKNSSSQSNATKNSSSWSNETKDASTFNNITKN